MFICSAEFQLLINQLIFFFNLFLKLFVFVCTVCAHFNNTAKILFLDQHLLPATACCLCHKVLELTVSGHCLKAAAKSFIHIFSHS